MFKVKKIGTMLLILFALIQTIGMCASPMEDEIGWIGKISGLSLIKTNQRGQALTQIYSLSRDSASVLGEIHNGLIERGWTVIKSTPTYIASTKENYRLLVKYRYTKRGKFIAVNIREAQRGTDKYIENIPSAKGKIEIVGDIYVINEDNIHKTCKCNNTVFTINGDDCNIILIGTCKSLVVNGDNNKVFIRAKVSSINVNGDGNRIKWSKKYNPTSPSIYNAGENNTILAVPKK